MKLQDALKRIEELERKVKELEARPPQHFHYHYQQPVYQPQPTYVPVYPQPWWEGQPTWTVGDNTGAAITVQGGGTFVITSNGMMATYGPEH